MAPDLDVFEGAYRRLTVTRLAGRASPDEAPPGLPPEAGPGRGEPAPRSRLLPRLALMAPRRRPARLDR